MTNFLEQNRQIIPNKSAPVLAPTEMELLMVGFASYTPGKLYHAGVPGHYFNFGQQVVLHDGGPLLATFTAADPIVAILVKQAGDNLYLYGVTVPKLIEFSQSPPDRKSVIDPTAYFGLHKVPRTDIVSLEVLTNSETHTFKDYTDLLISYVPFLKDAKLRSAKDLIAYSKGGFTKCWNAVLKYGELEERRLAAARAVAGKRRESAENSADGGKAVGTKYSEMREAYKAVAPFYAEAFEDRFDNIDLGEDGKPTAASLEKLRAELKCAARARTHPHAHALTPSIARTR
jgi:hypothetical protein